MHPRLPLSLKAALLASCIFCPFITSASVSDGSLGNVMYVGDSITHGINSGSYRWALHKIFADNGISYSAAGINTGNYSGGVAAGISYGGRVFNNAHSSQASARAYEIAGRADGANYGRFNGSNINNWLGLSTEKQKEVLTPDKRSPAPPPQAPSSSWPAPTIFFPTATTARSTTASPPSHKTCLETWIP